MTIITGEHTLDHVAYDADGDVLYLSRGIPRAAATSNASPEGHALRYDARGALIGVTIINARWFLDTGGEVTITIPDRVRVSADQLGPALVGAG